MMHGLRSRVRQEEWMDDPALDRRSHVAALRGLSRINWISRVTAGLWSPLRALALRLGRPVRVLDVASGAGDVPLGLARRARREGIALEADGCDISRRAVAVARARAARAGLPVRFRVTDALNAPLPSGYDVITSTLFLHHLASHRAIDLLVRMREGATHLVLVDDLRRSAGGLWMAVIGTRLLTRSPVVHVDGPRSVRAAFTPAELAGLAGQAGMGDATITPHWPWRQQLRWERRNPEPVHGQRGRSCPAPRRVGVSA